MKFLQNKQDASVGRKPLSVISLDRIAGIGPQCAVMSKERARELC